MVGILRRTESNAWYATAEEGQDRAVFLFMPGAICPASAQPLLQSVQTYSLNDFCVCTVKKICKIYSKKTSACLNFTVKKYGNNILGFTVLTYIYI